MPNSPDPVAPAYSSLVSGVGTHGPEVGELCALAGFAPDPEQQLILDQLFAFDAAGRSVAFETAIIAPRQNLKTGVLKMAAIGWLFLTGERLILWSAHRFATAQEAHRDLAALVTDSPDLNREVKAVYYGAGNESIELRNGSRLMFRARTAGAGRGLSGDKIVLDEAFALRADHMGALLPTLAARPDPQITYGSSAGQITSDVLRAIRDRGRAGSDPRLAYLEWGDRNPGGCAMDACDHVAGVAQGCALDDRDRWRACNPAFGRRIDEGSLAAFRQAMPPGEFAREFLGWWDDPAGSSDDLGRQWVAAQSTSAPSGRLFMAVDVAPAHRWSSIVCCGGAVLELVERRQGSSWLPDRMLALAQRHDIAAFGVDPSGPVGALLPDFERAGVPIELIDGKESVRACGALLAALAAGSLHHRGEPELSAAVGGAAQRAVGDGWKWSRRSSAVDISPLCAATIAHWLSIQADHSMSVFAFEDLED